MDNLRKRMPKKPRVLGPFEAATPPDSSEDDAQVLANANRLKRVQQADKVRDRIPSPAMQRRLEEMAEDEQMQRDMDRAAREAPARSMGTFNPRNNYAMGGQVGSASKRADGCAERGKTKGRMI